MLEKAKYNNNVGDLQSDTSGAITFNIEPSNKHNRFGTVTTLVGIAYLYYILCRHEDHMLLTQCLTTIPYKIE